MSLNGLDDAKVKEAHDAAIAEAGGWFLLHYASRDEIELLDKGTGGIVEIRNAIGKQEEPSPLYGFLRYRRRSVIIKYIPEDCSRLVQARAAVHFNAICDHLNHSTTFEISVAKDLKDSKLSAACSLHATTGSSSSSNSSLRRRRLNEIAEEEEEEERERKRQSIVDEEERPTSSIYSDPPATPLSPEPPLVLDKQQITNPQATAFASTTDVPAFTGANEPPVSPTKSEFSRRLSSQSTRPELLSSSSYSYGKQKVKLGPRPSVESSKRPSTASNFRPVAALPAGFKFFSKGSKKSKSQEPSSSANPDQPQQTTSDSTSPSSLPVSGLLQDPLPPRPATSSGASVKSTAPSFTPSMATMAREGKLAPEKARLMKAKKLREQKLKNAKSLLLSESADEHPPTEGAVSDQPAPLQINSSNNVTSNVPVVEPETPVTPILDSHPPSPGAASSSGVGESTKASSLSESTDETIQASKNASQETDDGTRDRPEELAEIVAEAGLPMRAMNSDAETTKPPTQPSQTETEKLNVSNTTDTKAVKEPSQIPESVSAKQQTHGNVDDSTNNSDSVVKPADLLSSDQTAQTANETPLQHSTTTSSELKENTIDSGIKANSIIEPGSLGIPLSKFSSKEQTTNIPQPATEPNVDAGATISNIEKERLTQGARFNTSPKINLPSSPQSTKRKTIINPIRTDLPAKITPQSEVTDPLDDDALMEELQTATLQEAKPMLVSKSPVTPVFPSISPSKNELRVSRIVSSPMRGSFLSPSDVGKRSASSGSVALQQNLTRQASSAGSMKKGSVGSKISERIKALEALSGKPGEEDRPKTATPSAMFYTVRKNATRESSNAPSVVDRTNSMTRQSPTPERSREPTPETASNSRERSGSIASRRNMFQGQGAVQTAPRGRPESVQVTARINRDASSPSQDAQKASTDAPVSFKQATLLVDVQRAQSVKRATTFDTFSSKKSPTADVEKSKDEKLPEESHKAKRRSSISLMKDFIKEHTPVSNKSSDSLAVLSPASAGLKSPMRPPSAHQANSFVRRLSTSSRRSSFSRDGDAASNPARSPSRTDSASGEEDKSTSEKKRRGVGFMRRLSNSFGGNRKNATANASPETVKEEEATQLDPAAVLATQTASPTIVSFMGDVNIRKYSIHKMSEMMPLSQSTPSIIGQIPSHIPQLPDNLLWKRRTMFLDANGFLILSPIQGAARKEKMGSKRFHLSSFRKAYTPDVEAQELPNSVVLDFTEGSCLQIACEDRAGQQKILQTLHEAQENYVSKH
ncbi:hypothetical protein F5Y18DRAFT_425034 [Xylariaceae sp. FL1019]|nr:hypothetical protein F5Y18DRAFT_425034 [Xylariaceae sp. FL1019]